MNDRATVLIVDDQPRGLEALASVLEPEGYKLIMGAGGAEALELTRTHIPDLVLLDVMMPVIDGFGVLNAIRSDPALATTPVVMYSALSDEGTRTRALAAGANDYIVKGLRFSDIQQRLAPYLSSPTEGPHSFS